MNRRRNLLQYNEKRYFHSRILTALLCGSLCLGSSSAAWAAADHSTDTTAASASPAMDEYSMADQVVTAERVPSKPMNTPANVTVITAKEIEANHYQDVAEALQQVNGIVVTRQSVGSHDLVQLNGDDRVVVLLDGQRLNNDQGISGRSSVDLQMLPTLRNIERIEVVKGGASALYGSDAVGGVINIITKKVKENRTTIDANTGSWGTHNMEITNEGHDGSLSWILSAGLQKRSYFKYKHQGHDETMPSSDYNNNSFDLHLRNQFDARSSVGLNFEHQSVQSNQYYAFEPSSPQADLFNTFGLVYNFKEGTAVPGFFRYFDNYKSENFNGHFNTRLYGLDYQNGWQLGRNHTVVVGAEWHQSKSSNVQNGYEDKGITNKAVYLQDTIRLGDKWTFVPGVRVDYHSMFGTHTTPKAALNYNADDKTQVYASWGRVYKAPTADDLYYSADYGYGYGTYGNPGLKPESGWTETLGIRHQLDAKTSLQASVFQSEIHDAINWYSEDGKSYYAENVNREKRRGIELSLQKKADAVWSYDLGYSYIRRELDRKDGAGLTADAKNPQPNGYHIGIHYAKGAWKSNLLGRFGSGLNDNVFASSTYAVFDFNLSYDLNQQTTLYLKVNNLTNQEYSTYNSKYFPAPGRFFQMGVTYSF